MRIAVLFHAFQQRAEVESDHAVSILAEMWRQDGHEVRFLIGLRDRWPADVALVHVDLSVVPESYVNLARTYPVALNDRISDIRKRVISRNLIAAKSQYEGPVIVKTNLNSAGIPEQKLLARGRWRQIRRRLLRRTEPPIDYVKHYYVYDNLRQIPREVLARPGVVIEKFLPEVEGEWFFIRRCFGLGQRAISYRMGDKQPIVDGGDSSVFQWIENSADILTIRRELGLDYGVIDYTVHEGKVHVFDVNKTPGRAQPPDAVGRRDYEAILRHVASGIDQFSGEGAL